ncbi:hypothetical protein Tco_0712109 [Tanacetum coccineum]
MTPGASRLQYFTSLLVLGLLRTLLEQMIAAIMGYRGGSRGSFKMKSMYIREVIRVEYEWKPPHCVACKRFGQGPTTCPNRVKKDVQKASSMAANKPNLMADQEEVFFEVKGHRKKGKAGKDMGDASNLGAKDLKEGSTS